MVSARVRKVCGWAVAAVLGAASGVWAAEDCLQSTLQVSGVYPHLAAFTESLTGSFPTNGECGIGAVVPWQDRLWMITYPPHATQGSTDKLYEIAPDMTRCIRPESVGGTHACRMIHRESNQLIIGPYFIDAQRNVRVCDVKKLRGRMTAVARHLTDPAHKVYFIDMEGAIYEVDVSSLEVTRLFEKPVPGWHGKGGYTGQGRLVISNNGDAAVGKKKFTYLAGSDPQGPEDAGVLAEWDGRQWRIVERRQFVDITGPGGIWGAPDDKAPLWAIGWDRRSVILKLLDGGQWSTFRLPKASHCYDPRHGWYTEWPRIRQAAPGRWLMDMHGLFCDFPAGFCRQNTGGLRALASHLRYIPDFCDWNGRLILASDDTSVMANPMAGQSQSNLWWGSIDSLPGFGPRSAWGGPWQQDAVKAAAPSDPFLIAGFDRHVVHLAHDAAQQVTFTLEFDRGDGQWQAGAAVQVPAQGYRAHVLPGDVAATWVRVRTDRDCTATAYFHFQSPRDAAHDAPALFASLAKAGDTAAVHGGLIRPAQRNRNLQLVAQSADAQGRLADVGFYEMDVNLKLAQPAEDHTAAVKKVAEIKRDFEVDAASVIMTQKGKRYRLPKGPAVYDRPFALGWPRGIREVVSERYLMNIHGTFYEMPRDDGLPLIKPVCSHQRQIMDFCTWRGLLVISGNAAAAQPDRHYFRSADGRAGVWLGGIDDLWQLGKPVGQGGPWAQTAVKAGELSDPYLMTNYDRKRIALAHDAPADVVFTLEVDVDHRQWFPYQAITVPAGKTVVHEFPAGFNAHWIRAKTNRDCAATAQLTYE